MQNLKDILSHSNKDIDNQKLMDYLAGKLSADEKHEVEKWMIDNEFAGDAFEGLTKFPPKKDLSNYVDQLNKELAAYILQKKKRRERIKLNQPSWLYMAVIIILLVLLVAFFVISAIK